MRHFEKLFLLEKRRTELFNDIVETEKDILEIENDIKNFIVERIGFNMRKESYKKDVKINELDGGFNSFIWILKRMHDYIIESLSHESDENIKKDFLKFNPIKIPSHISFFNNYKIFFDFEIRRLDSLHNRRFGDGISDNVKIDITCSAEVFELIHLQTNKEAKFLNNFGSLLEYMIEGCKNEINEKSDFKSYWLKGESIKTGFKIMNSIDEDKPSYYIGPNDKLNLYYSINLNKTKTLDLKRFDEKFSSIINSYAKDILRLCLSSSKYY